MRTLSPQLVEEARQEYEWLQTKLLDLTNELGDDLIARLEALHNYLGPTTLALASIYTGRNHGEFEQLLKHCLIQGLSFHDFFTAARRAGQGEP